ncbi:hypothetical protein [Pseudoalteromonas sp. BDTF-M6]|uniref:hypothetical protein n=1 Tax=Pseudoalteromonas sp. BDTF-M6 TaxID=2796132 RepID=UPI001BB06278|nr:hypothetical protein [Pseudoalteromonas sp. BDTF-M6]MBS3798801.1 hypothetical protein [Pseudoalteromonas sp. BDTF-M6]
MDAQIFELGLLNGIAIASAIIAFLSAYYARRTNNEAKNANELSRMNALLSFRKHYLELMKHQVKIAEVLKTSDSGMQAVREKHAELDGKHREINKELEPYHVKVVANEI